MSEMNEQKNEVKLEDIVSLCKRRGFVFQASEIYGGLAGFWDYGPLGIELIHKLKAEWWKAVVTEKDNVFGVDGAIIQNPRLWEASGHVAGFTDPLVDCRNCGARHRADHLANTDSTNLAELKELLKNAKCPTCGKQDLTEPRQYNMMMKTWVGPVEDESSVAYLRPETAGSIFTNYENVRETMRAKLPFGVAQVGKAFRNEISPRDFIFRVRELEQMEMQYFIRPQAQNESYEQWREFSWDFLTKRLGIQEKNLQWHEHAENERAHYAAAAHDVYFRFPQGFKELWGTHNRTDFDLGNHARVSGKDLSYFDDEIRERFTPYVVESSVGVGRMFMAVLTDAYCEEEINGDKRTVLKIKPELAPYRFAVSPLLKNKPELVEKAREVYSALKEKYGNVMWDDNGNIGKRYRRQDEIGTPYCVVVDFDTLEDGTVTIRDRDTTEQRRVTIDEL
ncbi:MAG: glycyl-tRNA synthetase [Patescibacteria group bacterium]|nr:glycine--tRNA ligase [Candidatus Saccharibacteria bacterium]MDQ5963765.1 glycyl-tRNA synthetase [Patescibacteria group bacterium]